MMTKNAKKYIDGVYKKIRTKKLEIKDLVDTSTLVSTLNTKINKTGYYGYATTKLALLGINTSLNGKITIKLQKTNKTLKGMLYTDHIPKNNTYRLNNTYYPTNWTSPCYFITNKLHTIKQPFTIKKIKTYSGELINKIGLSNYNRQTLNPNKTIKQLKQLNKLYNKTSTFKPIGKTKKIGLNLSNLNLPNYNKLDIETSLTTKLLLLALIIFFFISILALAG